MIYRCKYSKTGEMSYIAHLDTLRIFIRALRRADIPVNYSQGYSPHAKIAFSPALGMGIESLSEIIDVDSDIELAPQYFVEKLNGALPEGLQIDTCSTHEKVEAIPTLLTHSEYAFFLPDGYDVQRLSEALERLLDSTEIVIQKKSKKGLLDINVRERIYSCSLKDGKMIAVLQNSIEGALKPTEFLEILSQLFGVEMKVVRILKVASYFIENGVQTLV